MIVNIYKKDGDHYEYRNIDRIEIKNKVDGTPYIAYFKNGAMNYYYNDIKDIESLEIIKGDK